MSRNQAGQVVVITGASAGVGRATAREFAARGAKVGLLARGRAGLDAAARDVESAGGTAHAVECDVSDPAAVQRAADEIEAALGPIDVWVNDAFVGVFAPFWEISPSDFERVTAVTYFGQVNGTRAALGSMRPRNRGVIVQVGSALAYRGIPLQSAYCGAKHAIQGFTDSVRTELMHEKSAVQVTTVQLPALNTPQFSWVRSTMSKHAQPVPPIFQPEVAARAIVWAADHPRRKEYQVGLITALTIGGDKVASGLLDRYLARTGFDSQQAAGLPLPDRDNLYEPVDSASDAGPHGEFDDQAHPRSPFSVASRHRRIVGGAVVAGGLIAASLTRAIGARNR